ncbi:MAG: DUF5320 domain-containing protein [Chlorobi bacterium]|nr:DUF5320 domain-containing protein [Chlorobiota bacterium]
MPRGDKTGPNCEGPMTGRRMGFCTGNSRPGFENNFARYGNGYGRGFVYGARHNTGFRHGYGFSNVSEETLLENEIRILKDQLTNLESQLSKLNRKNDSIE